MIYVYPVSESGPIWYQPNPQTQPLNLDYFGCDPIGSHRQFQSHLNKIQHHVPVVMAFLMYLIEIKRNEKKEQIFISGFWMEKIFSL